MQRWMRTAATAAIVTALAGCEGGVLVNNRPERTPNTNDNQSQTASGRIPENNNDADRTQLNTPTTQPADQTVNTRNVRIESQSD